MGDATEERATRPRISVKFSPVGRVQRFLLPELSLGGDTAMPHAPHVTPHGAADPLGTSSMSATVAGASAMPTASSHAPGPAGEQGLASATERASAAESQPFLPGDRVLVRTLEGPTIGQVVRTGAAELEARSATMPAAQPVMRRATEADIALRLRQQQREREGHRLCSRRIRERGLAMKLSRVEHAFDGSRLVFYFTADGRIDFRELVRDLAAEFRMRIEMRQIGVRDEARMLGGYGSCGRPLCCTTWLQSFEPVSIKMAKQQNVSLNPSKLSGLCGRLKCCLRYEMPNGKGESFAGCAQQGGCSGEGCAGGGACGTDGGGCGACGPR